MCNQTNILVCGTSKYAPNLGKEREDEELVGVSKKNGFAINALATEQCTIYTHNYFSNFLWQFCYQNPHLSSKQFQHSWNGIFFKLKFY